MVAWPSGLRRWIKAPVSSGAWVRIPPLPRQPFRRLLWLLCLSKKDWRSDTACSRSLPWPHSTGFRASVKVHSRSFLYCCKTNGQNGAHKGGPRREPWQGSVAEGSKALDLGSSLFGGVGSNPTAVSCAFKEGQTA
ncbi:hypothetical protein ABG768_004325 [Culter alburnus]|uniref:Uncharacterized protein n=1 Tax=Culter alburnus TaxID=194366 RepID=A0AAW1ZV82_CULAL